MNQGKKELDLKPQVAQETQERKNIKPIGLQKRLKRSVRVVKVQMLHKRRAMAQLLVLKLEQISQRILLLNRSSRERNLRKTYLPSLKSEQFQFVHILYYTDLLNKFAV